MFVSDKVVFAELHKTGGSHIGRLLQSLLHGEQVGKHNRVPPELWDRYIIGSIRNPWDWYVSLWAYGCGGEGSVYLRTKRRVDLPYVTRQLHAEMGQRRTSLMRSARQIWNDLQLPVSAWRESYQDPYSPCAFRQWLSLLMDPRRRFDVGEGYGFSPISRNFGILTYRFIKLFTRLDEELYTNTALTTLSGLRQAWDSGAIVDFVIRNEFLEDDLFHALSNAGINLSTSDKRVLREDAKRRTNASRHLATSHYYDDTTIEMVYNREAFIIEKYKYKFPE